MKKTVRTTSILTALLISGGAALAQQDGNQNTPVYHVETRLDNYTPTTSFAPTKATPSNGAISENIVTSSERLLNKEAPFLKKGTVTSFGEEQLSAWQCISDEGGAQHEQTAPNPLTYFAAGVASDLLTQLERGIQVLDLDVEDVKVETKIFFRWTDPMTDKWAGYTDKVIANILVESSEPSEKIEHLKQMALKAWAVGESLANETVIDSAVIINGDHWDGQGARPGNVESPISVDNGFTLTDVTPDVALQTVEVEDDFSLDMHQFPASIEFSEIGIAESANDPERPFMHKIRAKSLTENYATWELYADDSRGYDGISKAPSSWDYFTLGTTFCLMSQLTPNQMYFQKKGVDIDDFRVEHQFNYQQDQFMTPAMTGQFGDVITRIIVKGDAGEGALRDYAMQSLRCCFAGEGIQNETEMESAFFLNGKIVK